MATTRFYHGENVVVLIKFIVTKTHTHVDMYMIVCCITSFCNIIIKLL